MKKKLKSKIILYILIVVIIFYLVGIASGFYNTEYDKKPVVKEKFESRDVDYLVDFYFQTTPNLQEREYYGDENAMITVIIYDNIYSDSTRYFHEEIFPTLQQDYINTGKVKLYHKHYLTSDDYRSKSENYMYAVLCECIPQLSDMDYYDSYFFLLDTSDSDDAFQRAVDSGIDRDELIECLNSEYPTIIEDMSEVENFGMVGLNPRIYIGFGGTDNTILDGVPSLQRFQRTLKNYQVQIGD